MGQVQQCDGRLEYFQAFQLLLLSLEVYVRSAVTSRSTEEARAGHMPHLLISVLVNPGSSEPHS